MLFISSFIIIGTCVEAGLSPGCCNLGYIFIGFVELCQVNGPGGCFCDRACRLFDDCCTDVPISLKCQSFFFIPGYYTLM